MPFFFSHTPFFPPSTPYFRRNPHFRPSHHITLHALPHSPLITRKCVDDGFTPSRPLRSPADIPHASSPTVSPDQTTHILPHGRLLPDHAHLPPPSPATLSRTPSP